MSWLWQPLLPGAELIAGATPTIPGVGPASAATFAILVEAGAKVTYSWQTNVIKAWSGLEQRIALLGAPRQRYDFASLLTDAQWRTILSSLVGNAATAQPFLLGLSYEALTLSADSGGATVSVWSTASADWVQVGQRAVVLGRDGITAIGCVIQSSTSNSITVDVDVSVVAKNGALIMPAMAVYLDAQQDFRRYPVNVGPWALKARAALFGYANVMTMGIGATVNTYASMPLWDRGVVVMGTASHPLDSGAELVDLGGIVSDVGYWTVGDWGAQLSMASSRVADWQWLKAFLATVRGMQVAFLAATDRPDLTPIGDAHTGVLKVSADAQYVTTWFTSLAHRRLKIRMTDGTIVYRTVSTCVDNGDGTQNLTLDSAATGTIAMVSFLETCRLASDDVEVTWRGPDFSTSITARVVQQ